MARWMEEKEERERERESEREAREVHGAPRASRFAWLRSSVSRAKAAGAPPH